LTRRRRTTPPLTLAKRFGAVNITAFVIATAGGLSFLLAVAGFRLLRSWNRMVVVIAFFALLTVGVLADVLISRVRSRRHGLRIAAVCVAGLLLFAVFDQNPDAFV